MKTHLREYVEKKERIVQTFLIVAGLLIAHTQNISLMITLISNLNQSTLMKSSDTPITIVSLVSASSSQFLGFLMFIIIYYALLQDLDDSDLEYDSFKTYVADICAFAASGFFSFIILLYMEIQNIISDRASNDYLIFVIFTLVIFSQLIVLPKNSILLRNKDETQTKMSKLVTRVIRASVFMFMFLAFIIYKYKLDKML